MVHPQCHPKSNPRALQTYFYCTIFHAFHHFKYISISELHIFIVSVSYFFKVLDFNLRPPDVGIKGKFQTPWPSVVIRCRKFSHYQCGRRRNHQLKMAAQKGPFQNCCSNSWMSALIWATFLPGYVVFIMVIHPVSMFLTFYCIVITKKFHLLSFWLLLFEKPLKLPQLTIFFIFSPGWSMQSVPIHCQTASYISETSEEQQLHS